MRPRLPPLVVPARAVRERAHALWDELAGFEASETDAALTHLLGTVASLTGAQNAFWLGVLRMSHDRRDPLRGWRPRAIAYLHPSVVDETFARREIRKMATGAHDPSTVAHTRLAGTFRALRQHELVGRAWFADDAYHQDYASRGIVDILTVGVPINDSAEVYYGFHRKRPHAPFRAADRHAAGYAMRALTAFHRQTLLSRGLLAARAPLTPTERRVLSLLLTERSEKEIGADLGLTPSTVHTYVREIYRKYGVNGRPGLAALWLGKSR